MGLKILIAEDSATNRMLWGAVMTRLGHEADVVASGAEAAEIFARSNYDLVFLDLNMPGLNGIETARRIRKVNARHTPVYAISGYPSEAMVAEFPSVDVRGCLQKPLDREKLEDVVRACGLEAKGSARVPDMPQARALPKRVLETCVRELRSRAQACHDFLQEDDRNALWREAHTVRALGDMLSIAQLSQAAAALETAATGGDARDIAKNVSALAQACEDTARNLQRLLGAL